MVFPSYVFIFAFLPIVLALWLSRLPLNLRVLILTLASYVFYAWWDYRFVSLLLLSTVIDFYCGNRIHNGKTQQERKLFMLASVGSNLTILGFFKYFDFFSESVTDVLNLAGFEASPVLTNIILPVGISFYSFQSMSYSLDIYRKQARPAETILNFAAYVALFPQLVAGPIVRYHHMSEQLRAMAHKAVSRPEFTYGVWFFVIGLSKKLLIADQVAPVANTLFDGTGVVQMGAAWAGTIAYTIQLYFDFSGYSDMAIGLGLMLGFRFPINFLSPYKSRSISEFWGRWHISLSHFLRDYLFIPLGGSRVGKMKTLRNLGIVMLLGGLWHGAEYTFVLWGLYHGILLAIDSVYTGIRKTPLPKVVGITLTFLAVAYGWVLFRVPSMDRFWEISAGLFGLNGVENLFEMGITSGTFGRLPNFFDLLGGPTTVPFFVLGLGIIFFAKNTHEIKDQLSAKWAVVTGMLFFACVSVLGEETPFIYFQF